MPRPSCVSLVLLTLMVIYTAGCKRSPERPAPLPVGLRLTGGCRPELMDAVHRRDSTTIKELRARGTKGDCPDFTRELLQAVSDDRPDQLRWLLEAGADPNGSSADSCFPPLALAYMERGFNYRNTIAVASRDTAALALLLKGGADPNRVWPEECRGIVSRLWMETRGITPLMIAAVSGDVPFVKLLLAAGAKVAARDSKGRTALYYARKSQRPSRTEIVVLLSP